MSDARLVHRRQALRRRLHEETVKSYYTWRKPGQLAHRLPVVDRNFFAQQMAVPVQSVPPPFSSFFSFSTCMVIALASLLPGGWRGAARCLCCPLPAAAVSGAAARTACWGREHRQDGEQLGRLRSKKQPLVGCKGRDAPVWLQQTSSDPLSGCLSPSDATLFLCTHDGRAAPPHPSGECGRRGGGG